MAETKERMPRGFELKEKNSGEILIYLQKVNKMLHVLRGGMDGPTAMVPLSSVEIPEDMRF